MKICRIDARDYRFDLTNGAGTDAMHSNPQYGYATAEIQLENGQRGIGFSFTLGDGTDLVCQAIGILGSFLVGRDFPDVMGRLGAVMEELSDHARLRWLGPHKGIMHLALASLNNALFDLWGKTEAKPLWKLLIDLSPSEILSLTDLNYLSDELTNEQALVLLESARDSREERLDVLERGYPGYDTSVGWFGYDRSDLRQNAQKALEEGFQAMKLKVGNKQYTEDVERLELLREAVGDQVMLMVDANQRWSLQESLAFGMAIEPLNIFWFEEPTHPDDILAHQTLARALPFTRIAAGEHIPNRVLFKNFFQARAMDICQVDCTRVAGVSEWIAISLLARKFGIDVVPHVGDMGQIHQHLVLFNHISLGHRALLLEHIPHLQHVFKFPAQVVDGKYTCPREPGASTDFVRGLSGA